MMLGSLGHIEHKLFEIPAGAGSLPPGLHMKGGRFYHVTSTAPRKWTALGVDRPRVLPEWG